MKELVLLMPPHATPRSIQTIEAARQMREELRASEKAFAGLASRHPNEQRETLASLRGELEKVERYIDAHTRSAL